MTDTRNPGDPIDTPAPDPAAPEAPKPGAAQASGPAGGSGGGADEVLHGEIVDEPPRTQTGGGSSGGGGAGGGFGSGGGADQPDDKEPLEGIWVRLLFMIGYGFLAWVVIWLTLFLAGLQFIVGVLNRELNQDLLSFSRRLVLYLKHLLNFVSFHTEDKPFPLGEFPKDDTPA